MPVGDVTSSARGSGARLNDGKPPVDLIPMRVVCAAVAGKVPDHVLAALQYVAAFQEGGEPDNLIGALLQFGTDGLREAAWVLDYGRKKYAEWNWAKGMAWSICLGCIGRHALAIADGEEKDPDCGRKHEGNIVANIIFLLTFTRLCPDMDDRPAPLTREFHDGPSSNPDFRPE